MNSHLINNVSLPVSATDAASKQYVDTFASGSTNYIRNTATLQSGATFYVSSGTVATTLTVGTNLIVDGTLIGNGSTLTSLTPGNISAGSLPSTVITSSDAVNTVYPAAVSLAAYGNIQGIGTQTQALNMNTHQINGVSTPTSSTDAANKQYVDSLSGTGGSTNYIQNSGTLQAGATFYVSSGTVNNQLNINGIGTQNALNVRSNNGNSLWIDQYGQLQNSSNLDLGFDSNISGNFAISTFGTTYITSGANSGSGYNIVLKPSGNGNVGVGTLNPSTLLHMSSGTLTVDGNSGGINVTAPSGINNAYGVTVGTLTITANAPLSINSSVGSSGQVLQSHGVGAAPAWTNLSAIASTSTINNQNTLQAGSTFYVSSGTVASNLTVGNNLAIGGTASGNGSGLTSLTAANISAGTLGGSVIASSIAVNAVYPAAVSLTTYGNIQGVGAQTQALNMNTHQINGVSTPTSSTDAANKQYVDSAVGSGGATTYIQNTGTLQAGSTFYVSSGTVAGNLTVGSNLGIGGTASGNGSGLTNLTAGNINAGTLGASVVASSIAVNAVYPAAVSLNAYGNIQGIGTQTQALNMNTHQINGVSIPSIATDAANKQYVDSVVASGGTTNYIQNTGTLQAGSTFYVSSGTVANNLTVGNNLAVSGIVSGNGSGLTNLAAANINAGTLGASVIASSIAVNAVYPTAVSLTTYGNIQGIGSQTQALNMNTHQINGVSTPTSSTDAANKQYVDSSIGGGGSTNYIQNTGTLQSGSTFYVSSGTVAGNLTVGSNVAIGGTLNMNSHLINSVSLPVAATDAATKQYVDTFANGSTNYIRNTATLQSGATFYVSSGTVATTFTVGTNLIVDGTLIGNGSTLTSLTPGNIIAGALLNTVIASSVAANTVYPAAVSASTYGNIQGVGTQTQALNMGSHQINGVSIPTSPTDAATKQYVDTFATGSTNYVQITNNLQSGATFYVSSGSVDGQTLLARSSGNVGIGNANPQSKLDVSGSIYSRRVSLTDGGTIAVDWSQGNVQSVTLGGNRTFTFTNGQDGGKYILMIKQDATGTRTATWPATVRWPGGTAPTLTTTASRTDYIGFLYNGVDSKYDGVATAQNMQ